MILSLYQLPYPLMPKLSEKEYKEKLNYMIAKVNESYSEEKKFFREILLFFLVSNIDIDFTVKRKNRWWKTTTECPKQYDENIIICLVLLKWIFNSIWNKKISNKKLILIRWASVVWNFDNLGESISKYKKKYPRLYTIPYPYYKSQILLPKLKQNSKRNVNKNREYMLWLDDVWWNDFNTYDDFPFDYYKRYIDLLLELCDDDKPKWKTFETIQTGIRYFLRDIEIKQDNWLTYSFSKTMYSNGKDSFDTVFYSEQWGESYLKTWNRFYEYNPTEIIRKFWKKLWWSDKKIEKYLSGK